jgi:hypothetical protein
MISLGKKMDECCPAQEMKNSESEEVHYPNLYIDADGMELGELPTEGVAKIKYRVVRDSKTVSRHNGETKKHRSLELEVLAIQPPGEDYKDDNLDKLRDELTGE